MKFGHFFFYLHDRAEPRHFGVLVLRRQHGQRATLELGLELVLFGVIIIINYIIKLINILLHYLFGVALLHDGVDVELGVLARRYDALASLQFLHLQKFINRLIDQIQDDPSPRGPGLG